MVEYLVHRGEQRWIDVFTDILARLPIDQHLVPKQGCEQESRGHRPTVAYAFVGVLQRQPDKALAKWLLEYDVEHRQQAVVQSLFAQLLEALHGVAREQQLEHLVEQPRRRNILEQAGHFANRAACGWIDVESELCTEPHGSQHPYRIFAVAGPYLADHAQRLVPQIGHAVMVIDDRFAAWIEVERIDGEVAAGSVLGHRSEHVVAQDSPVRVRFGGFGILAGTEGRDLDRLRAAHDVHDAESPADDAGATERGLDLFRGGAGRDVEVLRCLAGQQIAYRAADDVGLVPLLLQNGTHLARGRRDLVAGEAMLVHAEDGGLIGGRGRGALEDTAQQLADHRRMRRSVAE